MSNEQRIVNNFEKQDEPGRSMKQPPRPPAPDPQPLPDSASVLRPGSATLLRDAYFWLTLLLSLPIIGPLLQPGYFWGAHDARHSVYFLYQFNKAIQDGVWYPRWAPDFAFGYGYPFFNIYGPLSSYVGEGFHLIGLDLVTAVKTVFGLSAVLSGLTMYLFVRRLLGRPAGLIAALTYVYIPYHLFDLYVRAALAESVGFVFVPLTLWGFYEVVTRPRLPALLWAALAYAGLMFTSNLMALMFTPILALYVAYLIIYQFFNPVMPADRPSATDQPPPDLLLSILSKLSSFTQPTPHSPLPTPHSPLPTPHSPLSAPRSPLPALRSPLFALRSPLPASRFVLAFLYRGLPSALTICLGFGLSAIFWLPAILEYRFVRVDQWIGGRFAFGDDFVEFFQLFSPRWGFGASIPGPDDQTSFQIGLVATIFFILSFLIVPKLVDPLIRHTLYFFQAMTLVMIFLTIPISSPVWATLPLSSFAQFPWRLLVIIAPFISIVAGTIMTASTQSAIHNPQHLYFAQAQVSAIDNPQSITRNSQSAIRNPQSAIPIVVLSSLIILASYPYIRAEVRDPRPTEGPVSQAALFRFQQSADEMTGQTAWVRRIPNWSTLAEQVERGGQITTKVNYTALPADNSVGVYSMEMDSVHELLWVGTDKEGQAVTFLIPYYPGWRAYIHEDLGPHDGNLDKEVGPVLRIGPVVAEPAIQTTPIEGWMVVPIPSGSHFLEIRFEDTPVRMAGRWISVISIMLVVGLAIIHKLLQRRRAEALER